MKIINTTDFDPAFLRRMVSWCCKQLDLPVKRLKECAFRKSKRRFGGLAYYRSRIGVRIGGDECNREVKHWKFSDGFQIVTQDRIELLLATTAHELAHIEQFWRIPNLRKGLERRTEGQAYRVLQQFRLQRETLMPLWSEPPKRPVVAVSTVQKPTLQERRMGAVATKLAAWRTKLKTAKSHVAKCQRQMRYYEKTIAAKRQG